MTDKKIYTTVKMTKENLKLYNNLSRLKGWNATFFLNVFLPQLITNTLDDLNTICEIDFTKAVEIYGRWQLSLAQRGV